MKLDRWIDPLLYIGSIAGFITAVYLMTDTPQVAAQRPQPELRLVGDYRASKSSSYGLVLYWFQDEEGTECYLTRDIISSNGAGGGISCDFSRTDRSRR